MKTKLSNLKWSVWTNTALLVVCATSLLWVATARAASLSELLEQGVYSEETKGDLDGALRIYQQVVTEGKDAQSLAAQAQYRVGVCFFKKRNFSEANAAFEKVISSYPDQKELVAHAQEYLSKATPLLPCPWVDGEEMRLDLKFRTGYKVGWASFSAVGNETNGRKTWRLGSQLFAGVQQASLVDVEADSFKPIHCRWKHSLLGDADITYSTNCASVKVTGKDDVTDKRVDLAGVFYENEEVIQLMRRLPLTTNYTTTLRVFSGLGGCVIIPLKLDVVGIETVEVPAGSFTCHKVKLSLVDQTFWYAVDLPRYLVKFEAGGVIAELVKVQQREVGDLQKQESSAFEFALGAPGSAPTVESADAQSLQNQAKLLVLAAMPLPKLPEANKWCETMNAGRGSLPAIPTNTVFAFNAQLAGLSLKSLPGDTVVFFETAKPGWNRSGGAELLAKKTSGVAIAYADGRALVVPPDDIEKLRWAP